MPSPPPIAAVIPAAGFSSRMGGFKPLLRLGRHTIIQQVISTFNAAAVGQIIVVVGHHQSRLVEVLTRTGVQIVENPDYANGMFSSIALGVSHVRIDCSAFFVLPADIPLVRPQTVQRMIDTHITHPNRIIYPSFQGRRGHPPLIPRQLFSPIAQWRGSGGLKACLNTLHHPAIQMPVADRHILIDMDTDADYQHIQQLWERYDIPSQAECEVILNTIHPVSERVGRHSRKVAETAVQLGRALNAAGQCLDLEIIHAAGLLHDLAKGQKDHALAGCQLLTDMGFTRIGAIVGAHTDMVVPDHRVVTEAEVVHLADKCVKDDRIIDLPDRFQGPLDRWRHDPEATRHIMRRYRIALQLKDKIETVSGQSLKRILHSHAPDSPVS